MPRGKKNERKAAPDEIERISVQPVAPPIGRKHEPLVFMDVGMCQQCATPDQEKLRESPEIARSVDRNHFAKHHHNNGSNKRNRQPTTTRQALLLVFSGSGGGCIPALVINHQNFISIHAISVFIAN